MQYLRKIDKQKVCWLFWGLLVLILSVFCYSYLGEYAYRYPTIQNYRILCCYTIPNLLFLLLPLVAMLVGIIKEKRILALICGCVFLISVPFVWFSSVRELLTAPAICSHTEDPKNFGSYDKEMEELIDLNGQGYLPDAIPNKAENVHYYYYYEQAGADTLYVSVSWKYSEDALQKLQSQHPADSWEKFENGTSVVFLSEKTTSTDIFQPCLHAVIVCNEADNTVTHILTNRSDLLPKKGGGQENRPLVSPE